MSDFPRLTRSQAHVYAHAYLVRLRADKEGVTDMSDEERDVLRASARRLTRFLRDPAAGDTYVMDLDDVLADVALALSEVVEKGTPDERRATSDALLRLLEELAEDHSDAK